MSTAPEQIKVPIAPTITKLEIGKKADFPHIQYEGILKAIQRAQTKFKAEGRKFTHTTTGAQIEVTRVA